MARAPEDELPLLCVLSLPVESSSSRRFSGRLHAQLSEVFQRAVRRAPVFAHRLFRASDPPDVIV